uniref:Uncharacterized protein n=1 Tax=Bionectria ochroleuca TaxID=29856 RepID=A0A0B7K9R6_BIOOC
MIILFCPQGYDPFLLYRASCSRGEVEEKSTQKAPRCKGEPESGAVPKLILRAIVGTIQESGIDSCAVATRHAGSLTGSTLEMTRKVVGRPRNRDTNGHIQPSSSDDTSRILCTGRDASKASLTQQVNTWKAEPPELLNCRSCRGLDAVPFQGLLFRGFIHQSGSAHPKRATANGYQYSQEASRISFESAVEATGRIARVAETAMTHGSLTDRPLFLLDS